MTILSTRRGVPADVPDLRQLFDEYRQFYQQPPNVEAAGHFLTERLDRGDSIIFVAELDGQAVGFTQLYPSFSSVSLGRILILNDLYVRPEHRGHGAATQLLRAAVQYGELVGALLLMLSTAHTNYPAQRLYEKEGWVRDDEYRVYEFQLCGKGTRPST